MSDMTTDKPICIVEATRNYLWLYHNNTEQTLNTISQETTQTDWEAKTGWAGKAKPEPTNGYNWSLHILKPEENPASNPEQNWERIRIQDIIEGKTERPVAPAVIDVAPELKKHLTTLPPTQIASHYKCALSAVDMAVTRKRGGTWEVLLGRKKNRKCYVFPGGMVDNEKDESYEAAAIRELGEEAPGCPISPSPKYVSSQRISLDERYLNDKDKIYSTLYQLDYQPAPGENWIPTAGDDLVEVKWFALQEQSGLQPEKRSPLITPNTLSPTHHELLEQLKKHLKYSGEGEVA